MYHIQKKGPTGRNVGVFSKRYSSNCILNENLTHTCTQTGPIFRSQDTFFLFLKRPPPLPSASCMSGLVLKRIPSSSSETILFFWDHYSIKNVAIIREMWFTSSSDLLPILLPDLKFGFALEKYYQLAFLKNFIQKFLRYVQWPVFVLYGFIKTIF